jgi:hypothetical protein
MSREICAEIDIIPDLDSEAIDFRVTSELFAPYRQLTSRGLLVEIGTGPHDPKRQYVLA